jgi:hypothetical protein
MFAVGQAPIVFGANSFSVTVPLLLIGGDDGRINYGVILGDFIDVCDEATNGGEPPAFSVPEPSTWTTFLLAVFALAASGGIRRARFLNNSL